MNISLPIIVTVAAGRVPAAAGRHESDFDGPVPSIRLEQARDGAEDYEYLHLLRGLVAKARAAGRDASVGEAALRAAAKLVSIPNAGGQYSTRILPDPDAVFHIREQVARAIESLSR